MKKTPPPKGVSAEDLAVWWASNPDQAYAQMHSQLIAQEQELPLPLSSGPAERRLRIVAISDTHSKHAKIELPPGDILIHAGDFTSVGTRSEIAEFLTWFAAQKQFKHRVLIAGNHDLGLHEASYEETAKKFHKFNKQNVAECRVLLENPDFIYLEDAETVIDGIRIYGSPWQPWFLDWAWNAERGSDIQQHWDKIPTDTDILITHGPPLGYGDRCSGGNRVGCFNLLKEINHRVRPRCHIFGHVHEGYGVWSNGHTLFVNPATCNLGYRPVQAPIVFDIGVSR